VIELAYGEEAKDGEKDRKADEGRDVEASAIAAFLRRMVSERARTVRDPDTGERRPIGYGDIAVLARVTTNVPKLFRAFDAEDVPYAMAGGTLFLSDALHQQLFLALRALADRNDGVAEAALLRPPFFGVDLLDVLHDKARADTPEAARAQAARAWLRDARRKRFERSPGATARALLEETGLGRAVALGPNGAERLALVRELILQLELVAMREGLDYDGVTARTREWIEHAPQMDPPRPVGRGVVQVLSVHQAKGLEFPVVVLWDGMGDWTAREQRKPWSVDRAGSGWAVDVDGLSHEEPAGRDMLKREKRLAEAEKKRIVYVGATRAKDWLVVPVPAWANGRNGKKYVHAALVAEPPEGTVERVSARGLARKDAEGESRAVVGAVKVAGEREERERLARWAAAWGESKKARLAPASVTGVAKGGAAAADARAERVADASGAGAEAAADGEVVMRVGDGEVERPVKVRRTGRFGAIFGETVHRAIGMVIARGVAPREAVERAARGTGLVENVGEAVEDVKRAVGVLEREGIVGGGRIVRLEYPVGEVRGGADRGEIVAGYVDLVSTAKDGSDVVLVDFKTDAWVGGGADVEDTYPAYVRQVRAYGGMVGAGRVGLLFTARDRIAWVSGERSGAGVSGGA
jgi:ATP-dependent helicase/nuclease subunit A